MSLRCKSVSKISRLYRDARSAHNSFVLRRAYNRLAIKRHTRCVSWKMIFPENSQFPLIHLVREADECKIRRAPDTSIWHVNLRTCAQNQLAIKAQSCLSQAVSQGAVREIRSINVAK